LNAKDQSVHVLGWLWNVKSHGGKGYGQKRAVAQWKHSGSNPRAKDTGCKVQKNEGGKRLAKTFPRGNVLGSKKSTHGA